ncbi:sterol desaturase family protein [Bauldia litoralis]|uniref:Sterol desaturase/sphingolipid hydroxylase, fatty acid hydroxylase superfamily n=1 Tax=Bauldia litoralis TaxID=665467 RepID=A0A1G6DJ20_9HYPH|nr:sterol desaturase family protein [Bauldia litoralis]SDB45140.1 Sterol desaturase/sphingolipid hydroxylase, fatty acid hydroxylase superfamily [Bauldia litoralis]
MDEAKYGTRDRRGHWTPFDRLDYGPLFSWPTKPLAILKWMFGYPGYILPWNLLIALIAIAVWFLATPSLETMKTFEVGWVAFILARNLAMTFVFYGSIHFLLYIRRSQGTTFKYNPKWLDNDNPTFLFKSQTLDNMFWTLASGVPIWTAYEVLTMWVFANGYIPFLTFAANPVWFVVLMLIIPLFREFHFYLVHRLIHWPPLYRTVHHLHHRNVNAGPWSSISMHPVEHLLYFSGVLIHWIVLSHPIHAMFHLFHAGLAAVIGHFGFEKIVVGEDDAVDTHAFAHYLHHKYFEVNYADGSIPLDRWFGTFHDGSKEAEDAMNKRFMERAARARKAG